MVYYIYGQEYYNIYGEPYIFFRICANNVGSEGNVIKMNVQLLYIDGLIFEVVRLSQKYGVVVPTYEMITQKFGFKV